MQIIKNTMTNNINNTLILLLHETRITRPYKK